MPFATFGRLKYHRIMTQFIECVCIKYNLSLVDKTDVFKTTSLMLLLNWQKAEHCFGHSLHIEQHTFTNTDYTETLGCGALDYVHCLVCNLQPWFTHSITAVFEQTADAARPVCLHCTSMDRLCHLGSAQTMSPFDVW